MNNFNFGGVGVIGSSSTMCGLGSSENWFNAYHLLES
jgi:hypothetical protein